MSIQKERSAEDIPSADEVIKFAKESVKERGTVPMRIFNDHELWEMELNRIFGRSWVFIGHESEIPEPGDYALRYIANDPYIFVRGEDGDVRVLFNSCRHRATEVCRSEKGNTSHFRCPYHGWTYANTGDLAGVPYRETYRDECINFDSNDLDLMQAPRVEEYAGFYFASLEEDIASLEEWIGEELWYMDMTFQITKDGWEVVGDPHRTEIESNWKLGAENFAGDTHHVPATHQSGLSAAYGADEQEESLHEQFAGGVSRLIACKGKVNDSKTIEMHGNDFIFAPPDTPGVIKYPEETLDLSGLDEEQKKGFEVASFEVGNVFPNFSFLAMNATADGENFASSLSVRKWRPIAPDKTEIWNWIFVPKGVSQEYKEVAYKAMNNTFAPSGNLEPEDYAVWGSIPEAAGSITARKHDLHTFHGNREHLGMTDVAKTNEFADLDETKWAGKVDAAPASDMAGHTVYNGWVEMMAEE